MVLSFRNKPFWSFFNYLQRSNKNIWSKEDTDNRDSFKKLELKIRHDSCSYFWTRIKSTIFFGAALGWTAIKKLKYMNQKLFTKWIIKAQKFSAKLCERKTSSFILSLQIAFTYCIDYQSKIIHENKVMKGFPMSLQSILF